MSQKQDLSHVSDDDLLADLGSRDTRPCEIVEMWVKAAGYRPGDTRTPAHELLAKFNDWRELQGLPKVHHNTWGIEMARMFRHSRARYGRYYYISQLEDSERYPGVGTTPD